MPFKGGCSAARCNSVSSKKQPAQSKYSGLLKSNGVKSDFKQVGNKFTKIVLNVTAIFSTQTTTNKISGCYGAGSNLPYVYKK